MDNGYHAHDAMLRFKWKWFSNTVLYYDGLLEQFSQLPYSFVLWESKKQGSGRKTTHLIWDKTADFEKETEPLLLIIAQNRRLY